MPRLTLPILLALSFVLAPFTAASHARSRITTSAEIVSSELQTELLQEAADASFLAALAADFELWTVIIAPEKPTMEAESCAPVVGFFVWGLMPRPPPLDAKTRARAFDLEDDVYAELQAFLTQNPPLGYGLFRADLTTGIPELMFWDPNGLERAMLRSSYVQALQLTGDLVGRDPAETARLTSLLENQSNTLTASEPFMTPGEKMKWGLMDSMFKGELSPVFTEGVTDLAVMAGQKTVKYVSIGGGIVVGITTLGTGTVVYFTIIGAGIDATFQIDRSLRSFSTTGQITYYDPLRGIDSGLIGASVVGPLSKAPPAVLYALQAAGGAHATYQISEGNYVSGSAEALLVLAPFANQKFRADFLETLSLRTPRVMTAEQEAYIAQSIAATAERNTLVIPNNSSWGGVIAATPEEAVFLGNARASFGESSVYFSAVRFSNNIVIQRSDIPLSVQNVRRMGGGYSPFVRNSAGNWEKINLHHICRKDGKVIEVLQSQNAYNPRTGGPLHIPGPGGPVRDLNVSEYWQQRLHDSIIAGKVPESILRQAGLL